MKPRNANTRLHVCGKIRRVSEATGKKCLHRTPEKELPPICGASLEILEQQLNKLKP
jgi:hypothetical protein